MQAKRKKEELGRNGSARAAESVSSILSLLSLLAGVARSKRKIESLLAARRVPTACPGKLSVTRWLLR